MLQNRKGSKKVKRAKVERVLYKIDKEGNFSESKESMKSLYDVSHKEESRKSYRGKNSEKNRYGSK